MIAPPAGAERLGGNAVGLEPWTSITLRTPVGEELRLTGTPARHGPPGGDRGPVVGFLITADDGDAIYISGDSVWFDGVKEIATRADVRVAFLFMGAARVREVGPAHLTLTAAEGVLVARAMPNATLVPLHYEGWEHFSEGRSAIEAAFTEAGLAHRLRWLPPGQSVTLA